MLDGQVDLKHITRGHLERAAAGWGMRTAVVRDVVDSTIDAVRSAVETTDAGEAIARLPDLVAARVARFAATA